MGGMKSLREAELFRSYFEILNSTGEYKPDVERCKDLSFLLRKAMEAAPPRGTIDEIFCGLIGLELRSSRDIISDYIQSGDPIHLSPASNNTRQIYLDRLAIFYGILGLHEDDMAVALTKTINPNFEYPLAKKSPAKIKRDLDAKIKGSLTNLTEEQKEALLNFGGYYASVYLNKVREITDNPQR